MQIKSNENLNVGDMKEDMLERKPLPIGRTQFEEWSDRIIAGAMVEATKESLKWTLASMLTHIGPTESFREDAYYILALRTYAVKETAVAMMAEIKAAHDARVAAEKKELAEDTAPTKLGIVDGGVLENKTV
jgi:hypothetical protein